MKKIIQTILLLISMSSMAQKIHNLESYDSLQENVEPKIGLFVIPHSKLSAAGVSFSLSIPIEYDTDAYNGWNAKDGIMSFNVNTFLQKLESSNIGEYSSVVQIDAEFNNNVGSGTHVSYGFNFENDQFHSFGYIRGVLDIGNDETFKVSLGPIFGMFRDKGIFKVPSQSSRVHSVEKTLGVDPGLFFELKALSDLNDDFKLEFSNRLILFPQFYNLAIYNQDQSLSSHELTTSNFLNTSQVSLLTRSANYFLVLDLNNVQSVNLETSTYSRKKIALIIGAQLRLNSEKGHRNFKTFD